MYATNEFLTVSLLPSTDRRNRWRPALRLGGDAVPGRVGGRGDHGQPDPAPIRGALVISAGTGGFRGRPVWCARWRPTMEVLIAGRTLQGVAGGVLAGLGYALINAALPRALWTRASALVSAMWGVATVVGPAMGGLFAQFGLWRWAFGAMAILTALMAVLVPAVLAQRHCGAPTTRSPSRTAGAGLVVAADRCALRWRSASRSCRTTPWRSPDCSALECCWSRAFVVVDRRESRSGVAAPAFLAPGR